jgi:hypothetical protein
MAGLCVHPFLEKWDGIYHCCDCKEVVSNTQRVQHEHKIEAAMRVDTVSVADCGKLSQQRGVAIGWLVAWTIQNNCWAMPTWQVRRTLVLPATAASRCRYVELPHMREGGIVGPAATFVSHTCK